MNLETKIKDAFARHEGDVQTRAGAWKDVERAIGRSHRRHILVASTGAAAAIAALAVVAPRIGTSRPQPPAVPGPVQTVGWIAFESKADGFRLSHPATWNAKRDDQRDLTSLYPKDAPQISGKTMFSVDLVVNPGNYEDAKIYSRKAPEFIVTTGTLEGGYRYVRIEHRIPKGAVSIRYVIDWTTPLCRPGTTCPRPPEGSTLDVTLSAATQATWERYGRSAEQVVQTIRAIPRAPAAAQPAVVAKIPVPAFDLAFSSNAVWALQRSEVPGHAGKLIRIDPATNRQVAATDVGVWPIAVIANDDGVWVANGRLDGSTASYPAQDSVMRVDPATNKVVTSIEVLEPQDIALGTRGSSLFVTSAGGSNGSGKLVTIDPQTNAVTASRALPGSVTSSHIAVGPGSVSDPRDVVWVTTSAPSNGGADGAFLTRLDPMLGGLKTFEIPGGQLTAPVTVGFSSVWVVAASSNGSHALARFDPAKNRVAATVEVPDAAPIELGSITTGEGYVWAVGGRGSLWKIDPSTNKVVGDPMTIGDDPPVGAGEVTYGIGSLWVPSGDGKIWRLEP